MTVKVFHIMVMILQVFIKDHMKITAVQAGLFYSGDLYFITFQRKAGQGLSDRLLTGTQVQQGCHKHIAADPIFTFKI